MQYDVVIIGAGPGGSSAATFLARNGASVLLVDRAIFPREKICGDGLTPRGVAVIERLGVLDQVSQISQRIDYAKVIAPNGRSMTSAIQQTKQDDTYMLAAPRFDLDYILVKNAVSTGVTFQEGCKVTGIENKKNIVIVRGEIDGELCEFRAKYTIIATGANMGLLKKQGFLSTTPKPIIAARAYYKNADHQAESFNFHFNEVTLPGYGWIFPLPGNRVNVGIGIIPKKHQKQCNIKSLYNNFVERSYMKQVLSEATQLGDVQSYPIRTDFMTARIFKDRTLLVGEAAGLVNPLTGEGIDYAMECGEIAAEYLQKIINKDDNPMQLLAYEVALREKYEPIFNFSNQIISCCIKPLMLNTMISVAAKRKTLNRSLTNIVLGLKEPPTKITTGRILLKIFKHMKN